MTEIGRRRRAGRQIRAAFAHGEDRLAVALGVDPAERRAIVGAMLASNARRAPGYWLQLFLAAGIATLGLVLGSTAVVIGAMLVSPLMGPMVELGMGFAVGSSLLVLQAFLRVLLSVAGVIAAAAVMTVLLPFHEVTPEVAARTAPTLLDLLIAVFCALTAAYTTVRRTADTTAAAAGTAIGIALVPPLCVTGFGLGTAAPRVAGGAALLFTANFSAILVVAVVTFLALGFSRVVASEMEQEFMDLPRSRTERIADRVHRALREAFGSRYGPAMRLLVPAALLIPVYVPLSRALDEVGWEVRSREAVRRIVSEESPRAMQTSALVERGTVAIRLLIVGTPERAIELEQRLTERIAAATGVVPGVTVTAVPDARSLATLAGAATRQPAPAPRPVVLAESRERVRSALAGAWPSEGGALVDWSLELAPRDTFRLTVRHLGPPLGAVGEQLLGQRLSEAMEARVAVADVALPAAPLTAEEGAGADSLWLRQAREILAEVGRTPGINACVSGPSGGSRARRAQAARVRAILEDTPAARAGRLTLASGPRWTLRATLGRCAPPDSVVAGTS